MPSPYLTVENGKLRAAGDPQQALRTDPCARDLNSVVIAQNGHSVGLQQQNLGKLCGELGVLPVLSVGPGVGQHQSEGDRRERRKIHEG